MRRALFGAAGYGLDPNGTEESVQAASLPAVAAFHKRLVVPNNCVLAIFGDIRAEKARAAVAKIPGPLAKTAAVLPGAPAKNRPDRDQARH